MKNVHEMVCPAITIIGVAGGSGSGKSTLCEALREKYPDTVGLIQLDDYYRPEAEVPILDGMTNWECPEALFVDKLARDLLQLRQGKSVVINTKNDRLNPDYKKTEKRIPARFDPKPILLVEGFLVLAIAEIRSYFSHALWLEVSDDVRLERRVHVQSDVYKNTVVVPMHARYVEPSKQYASHIIHVARLTPAEVLEQAEALVLK